MFCNKLMMLLCALVFMWNAGAHAEFGYAVIVPQSITTNCEWVAVAASLETKYSDTKRYVYAETPFDVLDELRSDKPRYMALVLPPEMIDSLTVSTMHRLSRKLDDDPYGDALWGIITGYSASDAMRIVNAREPLIIKSGFGTTGFSKDEMMNVLNISDSKRGDVAVKDNGGDIVKTEHDASLGRGLTYLLEDFWRDQNPDMFVTSGHATQYNLELSFGQGLITCHSNQFYALRQDKISGFAKFLRGVMFNGREEDVASYVKKCNAPTLEESSTPKVWIGAGNCLLGDVKQSRNTMAVTALSAGGFNQLVGYTVTTWFGRMGWGTLGRFQNAQQMTLAEAFFLNNQALLEESERRYPGMLKVQIDPDEDFFKTVNTPEFAVDAKKVGIDKLEKDMLGLLHDRDSVAFYGDPRWEARMPKKPSIRIEQKPIADGIELHITTTNSFEAGSRFDLIFPVAISQPQLNDANGWDVVLSDDFILVKSSDLKPGESRVVRVISKDPSYKK